MSQAWLGLLLRSGRLVAPLDHKRASWVTQISGRVSGGRHGWVLHGCLTQPIIRYSSDFSLGRHHMTILAVQAGSPITLVLANWSPWCSEEKAWLHLLQSELIILGSTVRCLGGESAKSVL